MQDTATTITISDNGGDTPRKWSAIRYRVSMNVPGEFSAYTVDVPGVQSKNKKSDDFADVIPAPVGSEHPASWRSNVLTCDIHEEWAMAECKTTTPGGAGRGPRRFGSAQGAAGGGGGGGIPGGGGSGGDNGQGGSGGNPTGGNGIPP